jgi:hypothetical protein
MIVRAMTRVSTSEPKMNRTDLSDGDIRRVVSEVDAEISQYSCALFGLDARDRPDLYASCVILECDGVPVLITASHAIDAIENETRKGVYVGAKDLTLVPGPFKRSSESEDGSIDIAAIAVSAEFLQDQKMSAWPLRRTALGRVLLISDFGCIHGHPSTKNKQRRQIDDETKTFKRRHITHADVLAKPADYQRCRKDPEVHMGLRYRKGKNEEGNRAVPPDPIGISGGGMWVIPDFNAARARSLLAGIVIEYCENDGLVVFATRIDHVAHFIRRCVLQQQP